MTPPLLNNCPIEQHRVTDMKKHPKIFQLLRSWKKKGRGSTLIPEAKPWLCREPEIRLPAG
jgi:hypothetical protein